MAQLALSNVINVSVSQAQLGVGEYNTSNLGLFTTEVYGSTFGTLGYQLYLSPQQVAVDFGTNSTTYAMANAVFAQQPNILNGGGYLAVIPYGSGSETLAAAITRTQSLVQYFGVIDNTVHGSADALAAAAVVQPLNKILFLTDYNTASITGYMASIADAEYTQTRCLYYGGGSALALGFMSSYAGLALSTNFNGTNTTQTMHLKNLTGVQADSTMTQALLNSAITNGVDTYPSLQGVPKVFSTGGNNYYDQVYNLEWFVGAVQVAAFNYLAETATKIPQTEQGMTGFKGAIRAICQQAVANGYLAPGSWTSSTTFGNQVDFLTNIVDYGYYIYSQPVSQQNPTAREARQAPLIQIAVKAAGAIQSADIIIYVNQ